VSASPKRKSGWAIVFLSIFFIYPLRATEGKEPVMRVLIGNEYKARFRADGNEFIFVKGMSSKHRRVNSLNLIYDNNQVKYSINNKLNLWYELPNDFSLILKNGDKRGIWFKNRRYSGELRVSLNDQKIQIINYLKLEKYLKSVVGSEMPKEFPLSALQAQAIAARTYALKLLQKNKLFDVHSTQLSQVYLGLEAETVRTNKAVKSTNTLALFHDDKLIDAVFHSSSGGKTEDSGNVWKYQLPYLRSVIDFDQNSTKYRWSNKFKSADLNKIFPALGGLNGIQILKKSKSDRVLEMRLHGQDKIKNITGKEFREKLNLLSTKFNVKMKFNQMNILNKENYLNDKSNFSNGKETGIYSSPKKLPLIPKEYFLIINGYGAGHGVGMSQWGAKAMAEKGASFYKILKHYYTDVQIKSY
tara:strand:+ start:999 stop:2243 length:1245 start_codon:yes stop_codon:yes gene_type:complete